MRRPGLHLLLGLLAILFGCTLEGCLAKSYKHDAEIPLYANKVGPFHNPTETYR